MRAPSRSFSIYYPTSGGGRSSTRSRTGGACMRTLQTPSKWTPVIRLIRQAWRHFYFAPTLDNSALTGPDPRGKIFLIFISTREGDADIVSANRSTEHVLDFCRIPDRRLLSPVLRGQSSLSGLVSDPNQAIIPGYFSVKESEMSERTRSGRPSRERKAAFTFSCNWSGNLRSYSGSPRFQVDRPDERLAGCRPVRGTEFFHASGRRNPDRGGRGVQRCAGHTDSESSHYARSRSSFWNCRLMPATRSSSLTRRRVWSRSGPGFRNLFRIPARADSP